MVRLSGNCKHCRRLLTSKNEKFLVFIHMIKYYEMFRFFLVVFFFESLANAHSGREPLHRALTGEPLGPEHMGPTQCLAIKVCLLLLKDAQDIFLSTEINSEMQYV